MAGLLLGSIVALIFVPSATALFLMTDLGTLGGSGTGGYPGSWPTAINEAGQVAGISVAASGIWHAFLWTVQGGITDLGTLNGAGGTTEASDINNNGWVVGTGQLPETSDRYAFLWTPQNGMIDLGRPGPFYRYCGAGRINDVSTTAIGSCLRATCVSGDCPPYLSGGAIVWTGGAAIDIGTLPGGTYSGATAVNDLGQVVGASSVKPEGFTFLQTHAILWTQAAGMKDLGTLGGYYSAATDINNLGQVVGSSTMAPFGNTHAFFWTEEEGMKDLGTLGYDSSALDINDAGEVVGDTVFSYDEVHPFKWTELTGMVDLGSLPTRDGSPGRCHAVDLNNAGQVAGFCSVSQFEEHAFLWTEDNGMVDLGTLGGQASPDFYFETNLGSRATALNDLGQVVGLSAVPSGDVHAFIWPGREATPQEQAQLIQDTVQGLVSGGQLSTGQGNALQALLNQVLIKISQGKTAVACNLLNAFIAQVNSLLKAGFLSPEQAALLIDPANELKVSVGCL